MREPSVPLINEIKRFSETHRLTFDTQYQHKLALTQHLKWWACSFLVLWSVLFVGIPDALVVMFVFDCRRNSNCQETHFLAMLLILLPFFIVGLLVTCGRLRRRVVVLDGANNLYIQKTYTILGVRTKTLALSELEAINIQKERRRSRRHTYSVYQLAFHLRDYETYRLAEMMIRQPLSHALVQMRAFLKEQNTTSS